LLYSIFLGTDGAPASVSICKDVSKDAPVNILAVFVAGDYQAVYYSEIAVQAEFEILEALFNVRRGQKFRRVVDVLGLVQQVSGDDRVDKVGSEYLIKHGSIMFAGQPAGLERQKVAAVLFRSALPGRF